MFPDDSCNSLSVVQGLVCFCPWLTLLQKHTLRGRGRGRIHEHMCMQHARVQTCAQWWKINTDLFGFFSIYMLILILKKTYFNILKGNISIGGVIENVFTVFCCDRIIKLEPGSSLQRLRKKTQMAPSSFFQGTVPWAQPNHDRCHTVFSTVSL